MEGYSYDGIEDLSPFEVCIPHLHERSSLRTQVSIDICFCTSSNRRYVLCTSYRTVRTFALTGR